MTGTWVCAVLYRVVREGPAQKVTFRQCPEEQLE